MQPMLQWKTVSITYSECVFVALCIQHAMRMRRIVIYGCPAVQYFSTLPHKRHECGKTLLNTRHGF